MFVNFVTIVPITWDSDQVRYWVGFQVDIQPSGLNNGSRTIRSPSELGYIPISVEAPISDRLRSIAGPNNSPEVQRERVFDLVANNLDGEFFFRI
jgi:hypothetical protein